MTWLGNGPGSIYLPPPGKSLDYSQFNDATTNALAAYRNKLINGNFDVCQRGGVMNGITSGSPFTADHWRISVVGGSVNFSQGAFSLAEVGLPYGSNSYGNFAVGNGGAAAGDYIVLQQIVEDVRTFAGSYCTLTGYIYADKPMGIGLEMTQNFGSGGSPTAENCFFQKKLSLVSGWNTINQPVSVPALSNQVLGTGGDSGFNLNFWLSSGSSLASRASNIGFQTGSFLFSKMQLEPGNIGTVFERRQYVLERMLCNYFYRRIQGPSSAPCMGTTDSMLIVVSNPPMRGTGPTFSTNCTDANFCGNNQPNANQWTMANAGNTYIVKSTGTFQFSNQSAADMVAAVIYGGTAQKMPNFIVLGNNMYLEWNAEIWG